ncbi:MAG: polyphosphate polymerase domain-containing protein [Acidaminobacteraceae bacterium]
MTYNNFRFEKKYVISFQTAFILQQKLDHIMKKDKNGPDGYLIRSLYFDDMYNSGFYDKINGFSKRKKYRIRLYDYKTDFVKFEVKERQDQYIRKTSIKLSPDDLKNIQNHNYIFLLSRGEFGQELYLQLTAKGLKPHLLIDYFRKAYTLDYNNIRITFDENISYYPPSWDLTNRTFYSSNFNKDFVVLEIKFDNFLPNYLMPVFEGLIESRQQFSKYVNGRFALIDCGII